MKFDFGIEIFKRKKKKLEKQTKKTKIEVHHGAVLVHLPYESTFSALTPRGTQIVKLAPYKLTCNIIDRI